MSSGTLSTFECDVVIREAPEAGHVLRDVFLKSLNSRIQETKTCCSVSESKSQPQEELASRTNCFHVSFEFKVICVDLKNPIFVLQSKSHMLAKKLSKMATFLLICAGSFACHKRK